jgi:hypothetical protein
MLNIRYRDFIALNSLVELLAKVLNDLTGFKVLFYTFILKLLKASSI